MSFNYSRYVTCGIMSTVNPCIQNLLWLMIAEMNVCNQDYLQVFRLTCCKGQQKIIHIQEQPEYYKEFEFPCDSPISAEIFVIDDGMHSIMLLAEE